MSISKSITIVGFGDSITEATTQMPDPADRWLKLLQRRLSSAFPETDFTVINAGIGGNSAREAMARLDKDVLSHHPDWILLEFGGNNNDPSNLERVVKPPEFIALLERFKNSLPSTTRVIVITFPPVNREQHIYWRSPLYRPYLEQTLVEMGIERYIEITRCFAAEHHYPLFDLHRELTELGRVNGTGKYTLEDGVHLTKDGNVVLGEGVFLLLQAQLTASGAKAKE